MPMHVKYGEHRNDIGFQCEIHGVWKHANDGSANAFLNHRKLDGLSTSLPKTVSICVSKRTPRRLRRYGATAFAGQKLAGLPS
jgi:hypothetical protein